ncbi:MAG: hypothetical protein A3G34_05960, partial [Candidatus Lindowbacteria bacterium RIFCSPLOWO2_12_FULL_62_27]
MLFLYAQFGWSVSSSGEGEMIAEEKVLDGGFVRLLEVMGDDLSVVQGARVSYGQGSKGDEKDRKLLRYLYTHRHTSPFEMVEFKFHIRCPIFVARQWMRHRTWNYNEYSMRYSPAITDCYVPTAWRAQDEKNKQGSAVPLADLDNRALLEKYRNHCAAAFALYEELMSHEVAREMARMVIPVSTYTEFYAKVDLNNLLKFLLLRDDPHAQWEIQEYARAIKTMIQSHVPWTIEIYEEMRQNGNGSPSIPPLPPL